MNGDIEYAIDLFLPKTPRILYRIDHQKLERFRSKYSLISKENDDRVVHTSRLSISETVATSIQTQTNDRFNPLSHLRDRSVQTRFNFPKGTEIDRILS